MAENIDQDTIKNTFIKIENIQNILFHAGEHGLTIEDIAARTNYSPKSIQRYFDFVEDNNLFPIWEENDRFGVNKSNYLPPISLRKNQALYIFLALRMLIDSNNRYDGDLYHLFLQLAKSLPDNIQKEVEKTAMEYVNLPRDNKLIRNIELLTQAWVEGKSIEIEYKSSSDEAPKKRLIDIYFMQPRYHTTYIIAYCHVAKEIRVFKIERIEKINSLYDSYTIPDDFNADTYLSSAWGIMRKDPETVKIRVSKEAIPFITETKWHKSQINHISEDETIVTFQVGITNEVINWIMQWGELVEVLEPQSLRETIINKIDSLSKLYRK